MSKRLALYVPVLLSLLWAGCPSCVKPDPGVGSVGDACDADLPCGDGLTCNNGRCETVPGGSSSGGSSSSSGSSSGGVMDAGMACRIKLDCALNGTVDGRDCLDGQCVFVPCMADNECGRRFCVMGACADKTGCATDGECAPAGVCEMGFCTAACMGDTECNTGGLPINTCSDGRCRQRCLGDITCTLNGGLCENNVCVPPACTVDVDCMDQGPLLRCEAPGRCVPYTTCNTEADCDVGNACTMGRCLPLPSCSRDMDCAPAGVCQAGYCRPVESCESGAPCPASTECVGGSCVPATGCRGNADCVSPLLCRAGTCAMPPSATVSRVVISSPAGLCDPLLDARSACTLTVTPGDTLSLTAVAMDAAGRLISGVTMDWGSDATLTADVLAGPSTETVLTGGVADGNARVTASARGITSPALTVRNLGASMDAVRVTVVDGRSGTPVADAVVKVNAQESTTSATGVASFAAADVTAPFTVSVFHRGFDYVTLVDVPAPASGALEVLLPLTPAVAGDSAGGLRGGVNLAGASSTGPVSFALAGVSAPSIPGLSFSRLLGETFNVAVNLPVVGMQSFPLPGGITVSADVPVLGTQAIKTSFDALGTGGRRIAWTFGGRLPFQSVQGLIGQQGTVGALFALAPYFEGLTHGLQTGVLLTDLPYVVDGETEFDGVDDVNNNGNTTEMVPDYFAFPETQLTVRQEQTLRTSVTVGELPANSTGGQALLAAGARVPGHGFVPLGLTNARPPMGGGVATKLMKMAPRYGGLEVGDYAVVAFAFGNGGLFSLRTLASERLETSVDLGAFLPFPSGDSYAAASRTLTTVGVASADVHVATLQGQSGRWRVWLPGGAVGGSVVLPALPANFPDRATAPGTMEALQVGPALRSTDVAGQVAALASPAGQGFSRLPTETQGLSRSALRAP